MLISLLLLTSVMFLLSLQLLLNVLIVNSWLLVSLLNVAGFSTVYSGGPTADDIHDDAVVPVAAVISDFNIIPAVAGIHTVLAVLLSLLSCCCLHSCCCERS